MTKKIMLIAMLAVFSLSAIQAQKIALIDVADILENMDDYNRAQEELDKQAEVWRAEIAKEMDQVKTMYNKFQAEAVLMSEDTKRQKEEEIVNREKKVWEKQDFYFGPQGKLFEKREELVQPVQERVFGAIENYANERAYDIILDKNSAAGIIFANDKYDKTADIKKKLKLE